MSLRLFESREVFDPFPNVAQMPAGSSYEHVIREVNKATAFLQGSWGQHTSGPAARPCLCHRTTGWFARLLPWALVMAAPDWVSWLWHSSMVLRGYFPREAQIHAFLLGFIQLS